MKEFTFHQELWLPRRRDEVFPFFADACNLETLTPPWLSFRILTPAPVAMRSGTLIDYQLRVHGLPLRWRSEITAWDAPHRFVDEQRRGPYRLWIHEHRFEEHNSGTLCVDHVRYAVFGGRLVEWLFVRRDLERIFAFRRAKLLELFVENDAPQMRVTFPAAMNPNPADA
jgi:ligand-binding SRPBCC domain-containing protein